MVPLAVGVETTIGRVHIAATPAHHDGGRHGGHTAEAVGYLVRGSRTVYFAGDTALFPDMTAVAEESGGRLDVALLPVSGWG